MRRAYAFAAAALAGALLYGCGNQASPGRDFAPIQNSVYVSRQGEFQSALVENYDKDYYDQAELEKFLSEAVASFNGGEAANAGEGSESSADGGQAQESGEAEKPPVTLISCSLQDGVASSVFGYRSADDLIRFAEESGDDSNDFTFLDETTVADGIVKGYIMDGNFLDAKGQAVGTDEVAKQSKCYVVCVQGAGTIQTEGKVAYVTDGVTLVDEYTVSTPDGAKSYIIFK